MGTTRQRGFVTLRGKQWYGYFRKVVNDPVMKEEKTDRITVILGLRSKMSKAEARDALQREITKQVGPPGSPTRVMNDGSVTFSWFVKKAASKDKTKSPHLSPDDFIFANEVGGFLDTDNFRKRVLHKLARDLELPKLTFQVIRRMIATLAQKKGTVKDVQCVMRHSRTATTTDVYMQEIPESVQATVNSINRELRKSSGKNHRKTLKPLPEAVAFGGKVLKRGAVSVKVFGNLTPNDTKRERRELASC